MPKKKVKTLYVVNTLKEHWDYDDYAPRFQYAKGVNENCEVVLGYEKALNIGVKKFLSLLDENLDEEIYDYYKIKRPTYDEVLNELKKYNRYDFAYKNSEWNIWAYCYSVSILKKKLHK